MKGSMRRPQLGMTFIGILCILALVGVIGYAGIRLIPVYLNYIKARRTMEVTATEFKGENPDVGGMRRSLEHHWIVEDPSGVDVKDIEISKDDSGVSMHVVYDRS